MNRFLLTVLALAFVPAAISNGDDSNALRTTTNWSRAVELPNEEQAIYLFNGKDLQGWRGIDEFFSVEEGKIRAANDGVVAASTYLFTEREVRNFRLLLEVKQTLGEGYSTMHSAVAACGEQVTDKGGDFGHKGPLLMFCHDWGIWEAGGRGRVFPPQKKGPISNAKYEKKGEWNQLEILVLGDHVRMVANGKLIVDHRYKPKTLRKGPIGLQLHRNDQPQEYHFRGVVLTEKPTDRLLTIVKKTE